MLMQRHGLQLHAPVEIPDGLVFYGIDSQQRHSVAGNDYGTVRAAAFIGLQMIARIEAGKQASTSGTSNIASGLFTAANQAVTWPGAGSVRAAPHQG